MDKLMAHYLYSQDMGWPFADKECADENTARAAAFSYRCYCEYIALHYDLAPEEVAEIDAEEEARQ